MAGRLTKYGVIGLKYATAHVKLLKLKLYHASKDTVGFVKVKLRQTVRDVQVEVGTGLQGITKNNYR